MRSNWWKKKRMQIGVAPLEQFQAVIMLLRTEKICKTWDGSHDTGARLKGVGHLGVRIARQGNTR
jgi:hypothetical protein